jgi:hypothetical protein
MSLLKSPTFVCLHIYCLWVEDPSGVIVKDKGHGSNSALVQWAKRGKVACPGICSRSKERLNLATRWRSGVSQRHARDAPEGRTLMTEHGHDGLEKKKKKEKHERGWGFPPNFTEDRRQFRVYQVAWAVWKGHTRDYLDSDWSFHAKRNSSTDSLGKKKVKRRWTSKNFRAVLQSHAFNDKHEEAHNRNPHVACLSSPAPWTMDTNEVNFPFPPVLYLFWIFFSFSDV